MPKDAYILEAIVMFVAASCHCEFTADHLTDRDFLCHPFNPQSFTYQALLHGTIQVPVEELINILEEWADSGVIITLHFPPLEVEGFCASFSPNSGECSVTEPTSMENKTVWSIAIISGVVTLVVFVLIVVILIAFTTKIWRSKLKSNKK